MWPIDRPPQWVDRTQELTALRAGVEALRQGGGTAVWVEGEPGIGKSCLVAEALAEVSGLGWDIGWGIADQLAERLPLSVMQDCLQVRLSSPDPRRAHAAGLLRNQRLGLFADGDASVSGVEVLMALADELCAAAPTVMVIDDLQWADDASLLVWHQLAASVDQLRLLLIATCRSDPRRPEVQQVRTALARRGGAAVTLGPLPEADAAALVTAMLGTPPGDALRQLTALAAGNPLYLGELVDALARERAPQASPAAGVSTAQEQLPASLATVLNDRLSSVSAETQQILRTAALLGGKFTVTDLAVLLRRPVSELAAGLQEAVAARILVDSGSELAFRHQLIQQALYESMPTALCTALHAEAARELAATDADAMSVAQQLFAARQPGEGWARAWLIQAAPTLTTRAPQLAADLLRRELDETPRSNEAWDGLMASLVRALLAAGSYDAAARQASQALPVMTDPVRRAETYSVLARAQVSAGRSDEAISTMRQALASADMPRTWQARMLALLAMLERAGTGDLDTADATARQALTVAEAAGDAFATAHALTDLWLSHGIRRDHAAALDYVDQALRVLGDDPGYADLRSFAVDGRIFTLQNLDRWPEAELPQLELLLLRAPPELRFVLASRHDLGLGLHRLRLEGELTEIRTADLRFSLAEARALFGAIGVELPADALARLHGRTEGWAAGLRLAALSLAWHPDPERFAAEFSGTNRTVAEYLLAEVLDRQSEAVRRLLLRTSLLERVSGPLADVLTGGSGGERILQDLEQAGAFVVSQDARRSWFRYHGLFADLLQLELRRTEPNERAALHGAAAAWLAGHGHPVEAIRQAQAAEDWGLAARLLSDHWLDLYLSGRGATLVELLARFPCRAVAASPELTAVRVAGDLIGGSLEDAGRHLAVATGALASVPADRRGRLQVLLSVLRLFLARRLHDFPVVIEEAQRLLALMKTAEAAQLGLGEDLRAAAFISLGIAEIWALQFEDAERHLEQGVDLAGQIGRPYLELHGLAHGAHAMLLFRPDASQAEWSRQAIELAERHGWGEESLAGMAYAQLGIVMLYQGRLDEAEPWLERAERTLRAEVEPAAGMSLRCARAVLELAQGRYQEALAAFQDAEKLAVTLVRPHTSVTSMRSCMLQTLVRLGQTGRAEQALAELGVDERASAEMRTAMAALRLAADDPRAAADALAPVLDGSVSGVRQVRMVTALLLEARARDALGDQAGWTRSRSLDEQLTDSETRVLRYLPTHLTTHEIADELFVSVNTVSTHRRHLYAKLGAHTRQEAVDRARALGLLAPSARRLKAEIAGTR